MTEYRAGQRVRIEWPDGSAVEGNLLNSVVHKELNLRFAGGAHALHFNRTDPELILPGSATVTIRVRFEELWVSSGYYGAPPIRDVADDWLDLIDPVVLHEGWQP